MGTRGVSGGPRGGVWRASGTHRLGAERPEAQAAQVVAREHGLGFGVGHDHPEESGAGLVRSVTGRRVLTRHAGGETT